MKQLPACLLLGWLLAAAGAAAPAALPRLLPPSPAAIPAALPDSTLRNLLQRHPELTAGPESDVMTLLAVSLRAEGTIYRSGIQRPRPGEIGVLAADPPGVIPEGSGTQMSTLLRKGSAVAGGAAVLRCDVLLRYVVLPRGYDESRSVERVHAAMLAQHPDLLLPVSDGTVHQATVYMTEDGRVERFYDRLMSKDELRPFGDIEPERFAAQWEQLGLKAENMGPMGITHLRTGGQTVQGAAGGGEPAADESRMMIIRYAWPRRPGEPIGGPVPNANAAIPANVSFTHAQAAAVIDRYLPGALNQNGNSSAGIPYLVLSRSGELVRSGYLQSASANFKPSIEAANPGVRLAETVNMPVVKRYKESYAGLVFFTWLAPDAPPVAPIR